MKIIVCLDDNNGMLFNNRRQSKDREIIKDLEQIIGNNKLLINSFSESLFRETPVDITVKEDFLTTAGEADFCFVENCPVAEHISNISTIIIYKWNRRYPGDFKFDINPEQAGFTVKDINWFKGFSHEKITREIYER